MLLRAREVHDGLAERVSCVNPWVPVEKSLPPPMVDVHATNGVDIVRACCDPFGMWHDDAKWVRFGVVIAWQPIMAHSFSGPTVPFWAEAEGAATARCGVGCKNHAADCRWGDCRAVTNPELVGALPFDLPRPTRWFL